MQSLRTVGRPERRKEPRGSFLAALALACALAAVATPAAATDPPAPPGAPTWTPAPVPAMEPDSCHRCYVNTNLLYKIRSMKAESEAVHLRQGVGIFYTAPRARTVEKLQELVEQSIETIQEINHHPEDARLCAFCKSQFHWQSQLEHEVVHIERGSLVLITSSNPTALRSVRAWYGRQVVTYDFEQVRGEMEKMREEMRKMEKLPVQGGR